MKIKQRIDENDKNVVKIQGQIQQLIEENKAPKKNFTNPKYCFSKKIVFYIFLNLSTYPSFFCISTSFKLYSLQFSVSNQSALSSK
jgi:hypothetical protein